MINEIKNDSVGARDISAQELLDLISAGKSVRVVNVLNKEYYQKCHIVGSDSVPYNDLKKAAESWKKNEHIVVYCASKDCPLSGQARDLLIALGFTNVQAYEGGIAEWRALGHPVEGECKR